MRSARSMVDRRCAMTRRGAALHQRLERRLHQPLGLGVERRGRLVEDQDRRVLVDRARDRHALALAAGELAAVVADRRCRCPCGSASDEVEQVGAAQRVEHALAVDRAAAAVGDVGGDAVVEQHHVLADERELPAQRMHVPGFERLVVEADRAGGRMQEARQQVDQRRLARPGRADQRDRDAHRHVERHAVEGRRLVVAVAQRHAVEAQPPGGAAGVEAATALGRRGVDELVCRARSRPARG